MFDSKRYIEESTGALKSELVNWFPDYDIPVAIPNLGDDTLKLDKPVIFIEYQSSVNKDIRAGRRSGKGNRVKRKLLRYNVLVITTGDNIAIMYRDRAAQKIEAEFADESTLHRLARKGLRNVDARFVNAYKVRDGVHLARLEIYFEVKLIS